jgi:hypothetical protein
MLVCARYSAQELSFTKLLGLLQDAGNTVTLAHYVELFGKADMLTLCPLDRKLSLVSLLFCGTGRGSH